MIFQEHLWFKGLKEKDKINNSKMGSKQRQESSKKKRGPKHDVISSTKDPTTFQK
jgi:hypothetical protein